MATTSIAKAALVLSADGTSLNKGLDTAKGKISDWQKDIEKKMPAIGKEGGKPATPKVPEAAGGITSALNQAVVPAAIFGAVILAATKLVGIVSEAAEKVRSLTLASRDLGFSLQGFSSLAYAAKVAGVSLDDLKAGLQSVFSLLGANDSSASRVFDKLGLSVVKLRKMTKEDAFGEIIDALGRVEDPSQRASLSIQLFGDKFNNLLPLLGKGKEGIAILAEEGKRLGVAFDDVDASKLTAAAEAMARVAGAWEGLKNSFATTIAPLIVESIKATAYGLAALIDVAGLIGSVITSAIVTPLKYAISLAEKVARLTGNAAGADQLAELSTGLDNVFKNMLTSSTGAIEGLDKFWAAVERGNAKASEAAKRLNPVDITRQNIIKGIAALESELRDSFARIGRTGAEVKILDLKKMGAKGADLADAKELANMAKNAEIAFANIKLPDLEQWDRSQDGLGILLRKGRIDIEQYQKGLLQASKTLADASGIGTPVKTVSGLARDSTAAVESVIKSGLQQEQQDPATQLRTALAEQKAIQLKQLAAAEKLIVAIEQQDLELELEMF